MSITTAVRRERELIQLLDLPHQGKARKRTLLLKLQQVQAVLNSK